ncbi:HTH-type transcriptional regulator protein [Rhizobium phage RHph_N28_1]|nr:HTH-type transcriptional regulator protein [Rhizobium phage RHph_N28_1]QIG74123.1 HTH-type transcriptional regulator protein [Rhizobium phage RHph_N42]QXV73782.1 HTH-type transcriptional regulator protein [Rhizobium phage RHph_N46]
MQAAVNLTPRETEVLETMLTGVVTNKALAHHLKISSSTIVCHIHEASRKFGKTNRLETLLAYMKHKEGKTMERTFETASAPIMFICDTYQLPHAPVYWIADNFLCSLLKNHGIADRLPSKTYTIPAAIDEISAVLNSRENAPRIDEVIRQIESAVLRRFKS